MRIWIDVENLPDVPFLTPILHELEARRHHVLITTRREKDLVELCRRESWNLASIVGGHYRRGAKTVGGVLRAVGLLRAVLPFGPHALVNFTSRPAILAAAALRIPVFTFFDYEHVALPLVGRFSARVCVPHAVPLPVLGSRGIAENKVLWFPGLKEELYASRLVAEPLRAHLGVPESSPLAVVRPPARSAHYHDPRSEAIYEAVLEAIDRHPSAHARVLTRSTDDERRITSRYADHPRILTLDSRGDGLNLIWNADLVVSGGGTMTREAAVLGVPSYSIFTGRIGAVDRRLFEEGRIVHIDSVGAVDRIRLERNPRNSGAPVERPDLVNILVRGIEQMGTDLFLEK